MPGLPNKLDAQSSSLDEPVAYELAALALLKQADYGNGFDQLTAGAEMAGLDVCQYVCTLMAKHITSLGNCGYNRDKVLDVIAYCKLLIDFHEAGK